MKISHATATPGDLHRDTPWLWLHCEKRPHLAPLACAVPVIRLGRSHVERQAAAMPTQKIRPAAGTRREKSAACALSRHFALIRLRPPL